MPVPATTADELLRIVTSLTPVFTITALTLLELAARAVPDVDDTEKVDGVQVEQVVLASVESLFEVTVSPDGSFVFTADRVASVAAPAIVPRLAVTVLGGVSAVI